MKLDILAFAAHPDDVELACSGTLIKHIQAGKKVGVIDLTRGELGSRGSAQIRSEESARASEIMGITVRENLGFADGFFDECKENKLEIIKIIRKYRPEIILANAPSDRHPDHGRASLLVSESSFLSGLIRIETILNGVAQEPWRAKTVYHYIQDRFLKPDFVVDITSVFDQKMKAILAYSSQFYNPDSKEGQTPISTPEFLEFLGGRANNYARDIGTRYAEGFTTERVIGIESLFDMR